MKMKIRYKYYLFSFILLCFVGDLVVCESAKKGQEKTATFSVQSYYSPGHWIRVGTTTDKRQVFAEPKNEFKERLGKKAVDTSNLESKSKNGHSNFKKARDSLKQLDMKTTTTTTAKSSHKPHEQFQKNHTKERRMKPVNRIHVSKKGSKKSTLTIAVKPKTSNEQKSTQQLKSKKSTRQMELKISTQQRKPTKSTYQMEPKKSTQQRKQKKWTQQRKQEKSPQQIKPMKSTQQMKPTKLTQQRKPKKSTQQISWRTNKDRNYRAKSVRKQNSEKRSKENIVRNKNIKRRLMKIENKKPMSSKNRWKKINSKNSMPRKRILVKNRHPTRQRKRFGKKGRRKVLNSKSKVSDRQQKNVRKKERKWGSKVQMPRLKEKCKYLSKRISERTKALLYSTRKKISKLIRRNIELEIQNDFLQQKLKNVLKSERKTDEIKDKEDVKRLKEIISKFTRISKEQQRFKSSTERETGIAQQNGSFIYGVFVSPQPQAQYMLHGKALWIGLAVGIVAVLLCFVLCCLLYTCVKKLKSKHRLPVKATLSLSGVSQHEQIDGRTVTLAHVRDKHGKIIGSQYVANFEDKPGANTTEWSSEEEEVYNASVQNGQSPKISNSLTLTSTPNKKKPPKLFK